MSTIITTPTELSGKMLKVMSAEAAERAAMRIHTLLRKKYSSCTPLNIVLKDVIECLDGEYEDLGGNETFYVGGNILVSNTLSVLIEPELIDRILAGTLPINVNTNANGTNVTWPDGTRTKDTRAILSGGSDNSDYTREFDYRVPAAVDLNSIYLITRIRRIPIDSDHTWIIVYFSNGKTLSMMNYRTRAYDGLFLQMVVSNDLKYGYDDTPYVVSYNSSIYLKNAIALANMFLLCINVYSGVEFVKMIVLTLLNDRLIYWKREKI